MKKTASITFIILALTFTSSISYARELPFTGIQTATVVGGEIQILGSKQDPVWKKLSLRGHVTHFWWFQEDEDVKDKHFLFSYFGPKWKPANWLWIAPQIGISKNWTEKISFTTAMFVGMNFFKNHLTIFLEGEAHVNSLAQDYYGYYTIDGRFSWFNFGIQVEHINDGVVFGPHIGLTFKSVSMEFRYFLGLQEENWSQFCRLALIIYFT